VAILFGYNAGTNIPEDVVYKMSPRSTRTGTTSRKSDPGFTPMAKDFVGMQVQGINANPDIPVHPGPGQVPEGATGGNTRVEGRGQHSERIK